MTVSGAGLGGILRKNCAPIPDFVIKMFVRRPEHPIWAVAMHGFIKRFANGVFYPEEVQILVAAFDDAWAKLQSSRAPFAEEAYASAAQEILAKHIIRAAQRGERNPRQLTDDALLHLSRQRLNKKLPA